MIRRSGIAGHVGYHHTMARPPPPPATGTLSLTPIGVVHSALAEPVDAPRQPAASAGHDGIIELLPGRHFEDALADLEGFDRIWVLFWFHRNAGWRPKVLPPRSTSGRKGVFATRSPHRPNPLGLSVLRLERIEGLRLHVADVDVLDGTPVLDLKPYIAYTDAWPDARSGWLEAATTGRGRAVDPLSAWPVMFDDGAAAQAAWIESRTGLPLRARITDSLALGPQPHAYRRIKRNANGWQLAVRDWRVHFEVEGHSIRVMKITSGYRPAVLASADDDPALPAHRDFIVAWPVQ